MTQDERLIGFRDQHVPRVQKINRKTVRNFTQPVSVVAEFPYDARLHSVVDDDVLIEIARQQSYLRLGDILPKHHFLKQLRREKSRTDRSKTPLSVAVFSLEDATSGLGGVKQLLELLRDSKRETDILGYLGEDHVAILLTDTNEQGAKQLTQKIGRRASNLAFSAVTRTYPDQLFDDLASESHGALDPYPVILDESTDRAQATYFLKRGLDIVGAVIALLILSPLMLIAAAAIALTSQGPIIFKQIRLGKAGVPFVFYKFRSMRCNTDDRIHREYVAKLIKGDLDGINQGAGGAAPVYKMKSDPRITPVGAILRKTSIDELPQLFNVLRGDMSLVGPRPSLPYEVEKYQPWHLRRILEVRPGITGLWQVEGRSKTTFDEMVRLDLRYIRDCSLLTDLRILVRTVKVVLNCEGAS